MKKRIGSLFLALAITGVGIMLNTSLVNAATQTTGWTVTYDGGKFVSDYDISKSTITSAMPGDTISYEVNYKNASGTTSDFYVSTDVINSLEEKSIGGGQSNAVGGAYTYKLSYKVGNQETVIHDSETVGGDNNTVVGLKQAVGNIESGKVPYFNVGRLNNGQTGTIIITVKLDGNSQDNNYMEKLATLDLKFGAEKVPKPQNNVVTNTSVNHVVYTTPGGVQVVAIDEPKVPQSGGNPVTGDSILPIIICTMAMVLGIILVVIYFRMEKRQKGGA